MQEALMSLKRDYGTAIHKELGHYPVWDIGAPIAIGDYGTIEDRCFHRLGNIAEFGTTVEVSPPTPPVPYTFTTHGTHVTKAGFGTSIDAVGAEATLGLEFPRANSLDIRAADSVVVTMSNIAEVGRHLKQDVTWDRSHVFVSSARHAPAFSLLMNTSRGKAIAVKGDPARLADLYSGRIVGSIGLDIQGDVGLSSIGVNGFIYVDLMRVRFGGGVHLESTGEATDDVEPVPIDVDDV